MTNRDDVPDPPDDIPEETRDWIESLDVDAIRNLAAYLERRLDSLQTPLEEMISDRAAGEIRSIESQGAYAHVRMHPPTADGEEVERDILSIYHVSREKHAAGEETLHWVYLGDIHPGEKTRCAECGHMFDANTKTCPHCGGTGFTSDEDGGDDDE